MIWYVYIALVPLNIISKEYEEKYNVCNNVSDRKLFRSINIFVLTVVLFIYRFFLIINIKYNTNSNNDKNRGKLNNLSLFASVIFLIGGIINLYVEINGFNQELEI